MKHYHLIEYINIIHDKDGTDNINDQYSTRQEKNVSSLPACRTHKFSMGL